MSDWKALLSGYAKQLKDKAEHTLEQKFNSIVGHPAAAPPGTAAPKVSKKRAKKAKAPRKYKQAGKWRANERAGRYNF